MSRTKTVGDELGRTTPFRTVAQEAFVALLCTADRVRRRASAVVEEEGITLQQYNVLRILRGAGDEGLPTLSIADRMIERTPGVTRLIDRLCAKRLVRRQRLTDDRRRVQCRITARGLELLERLDAPMEAHDERALAPLAKKDLRALIELLDRVRSRAG